MPTTLLFFLAMAGLVAFAVSRTLRQMRERAQLQTMHPNEPWMWRQDWADRTVRSEESVRTTFLWFFGALWMLMTLPAMFALREQAQRDKVLLIFFALFPIAGILVLLAAIYQSLRKRKYGVSTCSLQRVPLPLGSTFRGEVLTRVREVPQNGFQVRLACIRRIVTGSGKSRRVREDVLWQDEQTIGSGAVMPSTEGTRVPVHFAIPRDAEPTDDTDRRSSILWRLELKADVPGIDYNARFVLPVYRTSDAPEYDAFAPAAAAPWTPPPNVTFDGSRITVRPAAGFGDWFGYLFFIALWYGALALVTRFGAPLWVVVLFGIFGAFVLLAALDILLGRSTITADHQTLTARRTWLGIGRTHTLAANEIESIVARVNSRSGNPARYDVEARPRDGHARILAKHLLQRRDAEGLAARIWSALGH